jgi:hypothetical protein
MNGRGLRKRSRRRRRIDVRCTALAATALLLVANGAGALTGREVIEQAQARNGFATWRDRRSLATIEGFDGSNHVIREAEVYEQTDPPGASIEPSWSIDHPRTSREIPLNRRSPIRSLASLRTGAARPVRTPLRSS